MSLTLIGADLVAVTILVFGLFLPRHGRRDLIMAYLVVNVGVMAVASALITSTVSAGLGLGLFGVLSIIRLRSQELAQHEVAYYFAALALGLLGGLGSTSLGIVLGQGALHFIVDGRLLGQPALHGNGGLALLQGLDGLLLGDADFHFAHGRLRERDAVDGMGLVGREGSTGRG